MLTLDARGLYNQLIEHIESQGKRWQIENEPCFIRNHKIIGESRARLDETRIVIVYDSCWNWLIENAAGKRKSETDILLQFRPNHLGKLMTDLSNDGKKEGLRTLIQFVAKKSRREVDTAEGAPLLEQWDGSAPSFLETPVSTRHPRDGNPPCYCDMTSHS